MAKRIQVSSDDITYYTLPGNSGELRTEMASVDDTVFGQDWKSETPSIGNWQINGQAFFKGVAGYAATVKVGGTPTTVSGGATTLVSGKTYQINDTAKRIISYANAVVVKDNAVDHTADLLNIDYLNGKVTFTSSYTVTGPVTIDYYYIPSAAIAKARSFNLTQQMAEIDTTDYVTAQANGGWRTYIQGLRTVGLEIGNVWASANDFVAILQARSLIYIDVSPNATAGGGTEEVLYRGFFKYQQQGQQGNVGALEEETLNLGLYVPDGALLLAPFQWYFGSTNDLPMGVQKTLEAWQNGTNIFVKYLADGTNGHKGTAVVTECSLQNVYEGQNEFSFGFRGTGVLAVAP